MLVGDDNGPTPVEFLLHALAACLTAGIANIAAARGVTLTEVESTVEGDIDLLGILGLSDDVRNGYEQIRVSFTVKGDDPREAAPGRRAVPAALRGVRRHHQRRARDHRRRRRLMPALHPSRDGRAASARPVARPTPARSTHANAIDTVVIGAGQAGLAMSRCLTDAGRDHVVLERGRVGRALAQRALGLAAPADPQLDDTPAGLARTTAPTRTASCPRPSSPTTSARYARVLRRAGRVEDAPVELGATPTAAATAVVTDQRCLDAPSNVVIATGWCDRPLVPAVGRGRHADIAPDHPDRLPPPGRPPRRRRARRRRLGVRRPARRRAPPLGPRRRAGRRPPHPAAAALPRHGHLLVARPPRRLLDKTIDEVADPVAARREPSLQLVGRPDGRNLDLATLRGRWRPARPGGWSRSTAHRVAFAADLADTTAAADARHAPGAGRDRPLRRRPRPRDARCSTPSRSNDRSSGRRPTRSTSRAAGIATVMWATGFRRDYAWLRVPVLDAAGEIRQRRGVTPAPGLYVLGLRFQHRRNSSFIDGVGHDAGAIADHL